MVDHLSSILSVLCGITMACPTLRIRILDTDLRGCSDNLYFLPSVIYLSRRWRSFPEIRWIGLLLIWTALGVISISGAVNVRKGEEDKNLAFLILRHRLWTFLAYHLRSDDCSTLFEDLAN